MRILRRVYRWEHFWLCVMVLATLAMHFSIITIPNELMFDEQHYVTDARRILEQHTSERMEHPPLAKLMIAAGMIIFGDNAFGWRFFPVIFGTVSVLLLYLICRRLNMSKRAATIATFLFTFETLTFLQASVAMLDVSNVTYLLAFILFYLRRNYPPAVLMGTLTTPS